jgi:hypothetical protein
LRRESSKCVHQKERSFYSGFFAMTLKHLVAVALTTVWLVGPLAHAATLEIHGVKVEDSATVAGTKLQLNGAGTRYKGPFKV